MSRITKPECWTHEIIYDDEERPYCSVCGNARDGLPDDGAMSRALATIRGWMVGHMGTERSVQCQG